MKRHTVVGTGGHIDHGKTALVKALTGTDTDRLIEEKERGITTDLGFAFLGDDITIIDVPGHERFVRTMVAGVSTIDIALLVIAADDGVMPQTIEHLDILRYLNVKKGLIALTKMDLVDQDWLKMVQEDIRSLISGTFLESAKIIPASAITNAGIAEIKNEILLLAKEIPPHPSEHVFRIPVDRAFCIKGFGTVVAGTILSGIVRVGDSLVLQPQGQKVRVRGLQVHESDVKEAFPGSRVGINIMDLGSETVERGNVLVTPGYYNPTYMLDVRLHVSEHAGNPVKHWQRVRFHIGTSEILARVVPLEGDEIQPGESGFAQLRLESPTIAETHDCFVIRQYAPMMTLGGGEVLEPYPAKKRQMTPETKSNLERLEIGDPSGPIKAIFASHPLVPLSLKELQIGSRIQADTLQGLIEDLIKQKEVCPLSGKMENLYVTNQDLCLFSQRIRVFLSERLRRYPFLDGVELNDLKEGLGLTMPAAHVETLLQELANRAEFTRIGTRWAPSEHHPQFTNTQRKTMDDLVGYFRKHSFEVEVDDRFFERFGSEKETARQQFLMLKSQGEIIQLAEGMFIDKTDFERGVAVVRALGQGGQEIRVGDVRQRLDTTRKFALPFLQYLDLRKITVRIGDRRVLLGSNEEVMAHGAK